MRGRPYVEVIYKFIRSTFRNEPLTMYGDGVQIRNFIYIEDVARANLVAIESKNERIYNVGLSASINYKRVGQFNTKITGSKSPIIHTDPRQGDIRHSRADIKKP